MHLLSGNLSEVLIIFLAVILGWNLPLTAIMLLWINLISDGAPALALAVDPYGTDIMHRKPKIASESIIPKRQLKFIVFLGIISAFLALILFYMYSINSYITAQTVVFNVIIVSEIGLIFAIRALFKTQQNSNFWLWITIFISLIAQGLIMYTPASKLFGVTALGIQDLLIITGVGALIYYAGISYIYFAKYYNR